ncbi:hypothetical protein [Mesorhizobium sp.]|uniref:hypothetical protein n=1 Tax=Mesorhizobium sp. TaxID=1871066 RepID=UPI00121A5302|nr:hypothetical protein [Mesorhizobium sp.]TIL29362.1 MAG: hypothetical protein E5Y85_28555 [Mesorhizobium sp.]
MLESTKNAACTQAANPQKVQKLFSRETISVSIAAKRARKTPETVINWCKKYGIGKQLSHRSPWRVDPLGLAIVINGDPDALEAYQRGDLEHPAVGPFVAALSR